MRSHSTIRQIISATLLPLLFIGLIAISPEAYAGGKKKKEPKTEEVSNAMDSSVDSTAFVIVEHPEHPAQFKKGDAAMYEAAAKYMRYPASAAAKNQMGTVYVQCVVDLDGNASDFKLSRSSGVEELDEEALRVCKKALTTGWKPAKHKGKPVVSIYYLPIRFKIQ